jgi:hypothetical protein
LDGRLVFVNVGSGNCKKWKVVVNEEGITFLGKVNLNLIVVIVAQLCDTLGDTELYTFRGLSNI